MEPYQIVTETALRYLPDNRQELMDLYRPIEMPTGTGCPGIVIIHGGGWHAGERGAAREINIGTNLARMGYVCMSIDYLLSTPETPSWPRNIEDCRCAAQYLRANAETLGVDPDNIGAIGGSAGGHLAACLTTMPSGEEDPDGTLYPGVDRSFQAGADLYGIADLFHWRVTDDDGTPREEYRYDATTQMLGVSHTEAPELWSQASPQLQASPDSAPTMILHGKSDTCVDYQQSIDFAARLDEIGVENELILLEGVAHTFHLGARENTPSPIDVRERVLSFFDRHLRGLSGDEAKARYAAMLASEANC
ncbi:MAG: alpha/beta hydrolase [Lentisphaerae bacterium]|jgi:acetyl esterase/lipase|nr:alpha/beta hydrolase [Lentisphaerota bacterium]MBT5611911.1 alpha/beta hydrolase [Lentisphaerota bacterium]MBT7055492.1 alpha/beta hydrolase [Lentisphaerota bacterium]MBT7847528.1 alpha/beta hydrolase [Lentisphaerota bacterium]